MCDEGSASESLSESKKKNDLDATYQQNVEKLKDVPLEKINTLDVNEVLEKFDSVDLLKINIEGGEYECLKAVKSFEKFFTSKNNELKVFARTNGVDDIHHLQVNDVVTASRVVAEFTDIEHI